MEKDRLVNGFGCILSKEDAVTRLARMIAAEIVSELGGIERPLQTAEPVQEVGALRLDRGRREVAVENRAIRLRPREFALLDVLARRPGRVYTREELIAAAWPQDAALEISDRTVDVHVARLRQRIGPGRIRTAAGVGYALEDRQG